MKKLLVAVITSTLFLTGCQSMVGTQMQMSYEDTGLPKNQTLSGDVGIPQKMMEMCNWNPNGLKPLPTKLVLTPKTNCNGDGTSTHTQRNEMQGKKFPSSHVGKYVFESDVSFTSQSYYHDFTMFQVHTGTAIGCAPPLMIVVKSDRISFIGNWFGGGFGSLENESSRGAKGYKTCMSAALTDKPIFSREELKASNPIKSAWYNFKRDGTEQRFRVELEFFGNGVFETKLFIDGEFLTGGFYSPPKHEKDLITPRQYTIKFGTYSYAMFDYTMTWDNPRLLKVE